MSLFARNDSVLLLVDFQPVMLQGVHDCDNTSSKMASVSAVCKAAAILNIPVVLTTISEKLNGKILPEIAQIFPNVRVIERAIPGFNAIEDQGVMTALRQAMGSDRPNIIMSGLWTSMCFCFTAIDLQSRGLKVFGLMDGCGDATKIAHKCGIKRMIQAGISPITWEPVCAAWMHDWKDPSAKILTDLVFNTPK